MDHAEANPLTHVPQGSRVVRRFGDPMTIVNFRYSGDRDKYSDAINYETTEYETRGIVETVRRDSQTNPVLVQTGGEREVRCRIYFPEDVEGLVEARKIDESPSIGDDETFRSSLIEDSVRDRTWKVLLVWKHPDGIIKAICTDA